MIEMVSIKRGGKINIKESPILLYPISVMYAMQE